MPCDYRSNSLLCKKNTKAVPSIKLDTQFGTFIKVDTKWISSTKMISFNVNVGLH